MVATNSGLFLSETGVAEHEAFPYLERAFRKAEAPKSRYT